MSAPNPHRDTCPDCGCCTVSLCATARLNREPCLRYALVSTTEAEERTSACKCAPISQPRQVRDLPSVVVAFPPLGEHSSNPREDG